MPFVARHIDNEVPKEFRAKFQVLTYKETSQYQKLPPAKGTIVVDGGTFTAKGEVLTQPAVYAENVNISGLTRWDSMRTLMKELGHPAKDILFKSKNEEQEYQKMLDEKKKGTERLRGKANKGAYGDEG